VSTSAELLEVLLRAGVTECFTVPCSVTFGWHRLAEQRMRVTATTHEGNLAGLAAGAWFATGRPAMVHLQNSGLGNAADGFISFANPDVYGIPMLALVTWRGAGNDRDSEPHVAVGARTEALCAAIFEPGCVFGTDDGSGLLAAAASALDVVGHGGIGVLRVAPGALNDESVPAPGGVAATTSVAKPKHRVLDAGRRRTRGEAIREIVAAHPNAAILFCNGYTARAAQAVADRPGSFYNAGYMGGTRAIGWQLARMQPGLEVVVVDGDQNAEMSTIKDHLVEERPQNLFWYVLDNGVGSSVGGATSVPLGALYAGLASVLPTVADTAAFPHPRVRGIATMAQEFRVWLGDVTGASSRRG